MNGYNYPDNLLALFVYLKKNWSLKKYYKNSHHCWTESLVIPQTIMFQLATNT